MESVKVPMKIKANANYKINGSSALEYRQTLPSYIDIRREAVQMTAAEEKSSEYKIELSPQQQEEFENQLIIAMYKQLYTNGFLSDAQLNELLRMHNN